MSFLSDFPSPEATFPPASESVQQLLVCEDEGLTALRLKKALTSLGYQVVGEAKNGEEAVRLVRIVSVFPSEEVAVRALRGCGPALPAPESWAAARALTLDRWRMIRDALDTSPTEQVLHELTSRTALCERAEELYREHPAPAEVGCQYCPLFGALGGRAEDIGCRSVLGPMMALQSDDREAVRAQIDILIGQIEAMPLPQDVAPGSASAAG